jgi:pimeloyl-ACP methyl ester carboxylesterase
MMLAMSTTSPADTIVLIHGLWMTPLSWEHWIERFEAAGHPVLAPAWPGFDRDIEDVRRDMTPYEGLGITEIADHYDRIIRGLDAPPIIMGHSFGGLLTQILLARGLGAAGVAIDPAGPKGILALPASTFRVVWPVLNNPANKSKAKALTPAQFHYAFGNTLSEQDSQAVYERYAVPGPGRPLFQAVSANFNPNAATKIDFHNDTRAPLLILGGGQDHTVAAVSTRANYKLQSKSKAVTEYKEYEERSHWTCGEPGWEAVADHALEWAVTQAAKAAVPH